MTTWERIKLKAELEMRDADMMKGACEERGEKARALYYLGRVDAWHECYSWAVGQEWKEKGNV